MRVETKINRNKTYQKASNEVRKKLQRVIIYGVNAVRNTAVDGILRGAKTGEIYEKYNPRRTHKASSSGEYPASDTGFLANNIVTKVATDGLSGKITSRANYSAFLEFGTIKMGARPFMQPSLEQNRPKIRARARKEFK